jgi:hypothetical protein
VVCGLADAVDYIETFEFDDDELIYVASLTGNDGQRLFEDRFLEYLRNLRFTSDIDAIPEGTLVFPHEPQVRVKGTILQRELLETTLLNIVDFQTLIVTKAARKLGGEFIGDMIYNEETPMKSEQVIVDPVNLSRSKKDALGGYYRRSYPHLQRRETSLQVAEN